MFKQILRAMLLIQLLTTFHGAEDQLVIENKDKIDQIRAIKEATDEQEEPEILEFEVDKSHSSVGFSVVHLMVSKVKGQFVDFSGKARATEEGELLSLEGEVLIDSVDTRNKKRDDHLRNEDFFFVKHFPKMSFQSKEITVKDGILKVSGDLSLRGKIQKVELNGEMRGPVDDPWGRILLGLSLEGIINRQDFGLKWNKTLDSGGFIVGNEVVIQLDLELAHNPAGN